METIDYECNFHNALYQLFVVKYHTLLNPISITVINSTSKIQAFVYPDKKKTIVSYTSKNIPDDIVNILYSYLNFAKHPLPEHIIASTIPYIVFRKLKSQTHDFIVFRTKTYTFRATIKEDAYHYSIKIGGKEFAECIDLFVYKQESVSKLAQIYSEPECWHQLGKKGSIVDLLKGSLQLCQMLFGTNMFCFDDFSNIECGETNQTQNPPKKFNKPFSLTYKSIAEKGETWYEQHFNAFIQNSEMYKMYLQAKMQLQNPAAKPDYESFRIQSHISDTQSEYLKPFYESSKTWHDFFIKVPKNLQCRAFYNWLPEYMERYILKFSPVKHQWCIYLGNLGISDNEVSSSMPSMIRTNMFIEMKPSVIQQWGGSKTTQSQKKRKSHKQTRKLQTKLLTFSNRFGYA